MAAPKSKALTTEQGKSGTLISSGAISGEDYNYRLSGPNAIKEYEQMRRNDATVRAAMQAIKMPIKAANYTVDPASEDEKDILVADFVNHCLFEQVDWKKTLNEVLTYLDLGFSLFEQCYEAIDYKGQRYIALTKLAYRKQTTIQKWETEGGEPGVTQSVAGELYSIPLFKLVRFTHEQEGDNYEGISLLRTSYKNWKIKDKLYKIDAVGHEKHGLGIVDITYPKGTHETVKKAARKAARNMRANEQSYVDHEEGITFAFMDMKSNTLRDIKPSIDHHDRQIMKNVLAQFLEIGASGSSGTRNVSEDQSRLFTMSVQGVAEHVVKIIQDYVIKRLVDLNFTDAAYPTLRVDKIDDDNVPVLSEAFSKFVTAGVLHPRPADEQAVRRIIGMPQVDDDELEALYEAGEPEPDEVKDKLAAARQLRASLEKDLYGQSRAA